MRDASALYRYQPHKNVPSCLTRYQHGIGRAKTPTPDNCFFVCTPVYLSRFSFNRPPCFRDTASCNFLGRPKQPYYLAVAGRMLNEDAIAKLTPGDRKEYRRFLFPPALADPKHEPYLSIETITTWITDGGYVLYAQHDPVDNVVPYVDVEDVPGDQIVAYRELILPELYRQHPFFSLDHAVDWVLAAPFQLYQQSALPQPRGRSQTALHALSRTTSAAPSRASSRASYISQFYESSAVESPPLTRAPSSIGSSRLSLPPGTDGTHRAGPFLRIQVPIPWSALRESNPERTRGKSKLRDTGFRFTREEWIERIIPVTEAPSTWNIPRDAAVYRLDLTALKKQLQLPSGEIMTIDAFIKQQDQESWGHGSGGHKAGDVWVHGFSDNPEERVWARRVNSHCNGVKICELVSDELFADCQRYASDEEQGMRLWTHELDANEREAASGGKILLRFYAIVHRAKCKKKDCQGKPTLILLRNRPNQHGKVYFVGCSDFNPSEPYMHLYLPIPPNVDESQFKFVLENNGCLPIGLEVPNSDSCVLSTHPRLGLTTCPYGHSRDGTALIAKMVARPCPAEMIILVPCEHKGTPPPAWTEYMAMVLLRNFHNHPEHALTKPTMEDKQKLLSVLDDVGVEGMTVQRLLNDPRTIAAYGGERLAKESPAFASSRVLNDFITAQKKAKYPHGMGWEGVLHHMGRELALSDRYIHAAIAKDGYRIVVTMHHELAPLIHSARYLCIDYTFKRVEGTMNEWEIAIFNDRYNMRAYFNAIFCILYCDRNTEAAFYQLFYELFDVVRHVTGRELAIRPFRPDGNCRVVLMDGEEAQVLGYGNFLVQYNDPVVSGINSRDPIILLSYSYKVCQVHAQRNIDKLPKTIPVDVIRTLKSITGLKSQVEIDKWVAFCESQSYEAVINWFRPKRNGWFLQSVNRFLSNIAEEDWDLTPNNTNIVESAHARRNAETSIHLPLLASILKAEERDDARHEAILQIERQGVIAKRWNGPFEHLPCPNIDTPETP
ncbi:hypothetical protein GGX14DRAFT_607445 [Mycena pura]|uniref:Uncharacterized protein n=1 Tax=Mycena pura TaxID=153505 RepID=A0AAD6XZJ7_9AGAR|nr:hypothetical protein GGX14DRAFT_607445 [Mycena pura]